jgi:ssDNA-binding Zn-finger/Zn-ribbon topoisomerase 1
MRTRRGSRGDFLGCVNYPTCTGSRSITETPAGTEAPRGATVKPPTPTRTEVPGPAGALLTDLRSAAGHIGHAIDILRRRQAEIDGLMDERDEIPF